MRVRQEVIGRLAELRIVHDLIAAPTDDRRVLLVTGEAGIGKSVMLAHGARCAERAGSRVVSLRCRAAEQHLAWCSLTEIVDALDVPADLPAAQRRSLDVIRQRWGAGGRPADPRLAAAALASVLRNQLATTPLTLSIDDINWIDPESMNALVFAWRRAAGPMTLALAVRSSQLHEVRSSSLLDDVVLTEVRLGPLGPADLAELLAARGIAGSSDWRRIQELSGGNPLYAITLARHFEMDGDDVSLPVDLSDAIWCLIDGLDQTTADVLAIVAALGPRPISVIASIARRLGAEQTVDAVIDSLEPAEDRGLITLADGTARFTHPLHAAVVLERLSSGRRRRLHASCAAELDDPVEQAHHRALAAVGFDPELAREIDAAVRLLSGRGAHRTAADLARRVLAMTPTDDPAGRIERTLRCAAESSAAGAPRPVILTLAGIDQLLIESPDADALARASLLRATATQFVDGPETAAAMFEQATIHAESAGRADLAAEAHLHLASLFAFEPKRSRSHAAAAIEARRRFTGEQDDVTKLAEMWQRWGDIQCSNPRGFDDDMPCVPGSELADDPATHVLPAWFALAHDQVAIAERCIANACERATRDGHEHSAAVFHAAAAEVASSACAWADARRHAEQAIRLAHLDGRRHVTEWATAVGNLAAVRSGSGRLDPIDSTVIVADAFNRHARGALLLTQSKPDEAVAVLLGLQDLLSMIGMREPVRVRYEGDLLDAAAGCDDVDTVCTVVAGLDERHRHLPRLYTAALAGRGRALAAATSGDLEAARDEADAAMIHHERLGLADETARMHVVAGGIHRRLRHWQLAGDHLRTAVEIFTELEAMPWAERAEDELARIGKRGTRGGDGLTSAERRIAELAAEGRTNSEIASTAFVSVKTVESTLTRVYRKLGIRGRVELRSRM